MAITTLLCVAKSNKDAVRSSKLKAKRVEGKTRRLMAALEKERQKVQELEVAIKEYEGYCYQCKSKYDVLYSDMTKLKLSYQSIMDSNESLQSNIYDLISKGLVLSDTSQTGVIQELEQKGLVNTLKIQDMSVGEVQSFFGAHILH